MEYLYLNRNNIIRRELYSSIDGIESLIGDISQVTRIVAVCVNNANEIVIDSDITAAAFDFVTEAADSIVRLHFNDLTDFDTYENKIFKVTLIVFDTVNTNGVRYLPFQMKIIKELIG